MLVVKKKEIPPLPLNLPIFQLSDWLLSEFPKLPVLPPGQLFESVNIDSLLSLAVPSLPHHLLHQVGHGPVRVLGDGDVLLDNGPRLLSVCRGMIVSAVLPYSALPG